MPLTFQQQAFFEELGFLTKLSEVRRLVMEHKIIHPVPDSKTFYAMLDDGTLEGRQMGRGNEYYVYKDSVRAWVLSLQTDEYRLPEKTGLRLAA